MSRFDDMKEKIVTAMQADDGGLSGMVDIFSELEKDYVELESAREMIDDLTAKNQSLHDTNMKLFLAQTSGSDDDGEDEEIPEETLETILEKLEKEEED